MLITPSLPARFLPSNVMKLPPYPRIPPSSACMRACPSRSRQPYTLREPIVMCPKIYLSCPGAEGIHPPLTCGLIMIQHLHVNACLERHKTLGRIRLDVNVPLFVACCLVPAFLISGSLAWQFLYVGKAIVYFTY